jgi:hypothetical protein
VGVLEAWEEAGAEDETLTDGGLELFKYQLAGHSQGSSKSISQAEMDMTTIAINLPQGAIPPRLYPDRRPWRLGGESRECDVCRIAEWIVNELESRLFKGRMVFGQITDKLARDVVSRGQVRSSIWRARRRHGSACRIPASSCINRWAARAVRQPTSRSRRASLSRFARLAIC